jgi:tol-pal system protein YbgF
MFRCLILRGIRVGAVLVIVASPVIARGQTTEDRLDRLERDLNMLQRQVYRGVPVMQGGSAGSTNAADIEIRMERLEAQMRDLTGRVEQVGNGLEQLRQRLEQVNSDLDVRFGQMGGGSVASAPPPSRPSTAEGRVASGGAFPPPLGGGSFPPPLGGGSFPAPGSVLPPPSSGSGGLNPIFNTLSPPGTAPARPPAPEQASVAPSGGGSVNEQFNHAFGLVKQADYPAAEAALRAFVEAHPNDPLAGNAQYWLGQTYYARSKYPEAAAAFAEDYKRYPKGSKAAEALLYLGMSLAKADQKKNACLALAQLSEAFPNASGAIRERAAAEKKRLACS